ncbi:nuclear transport factor 2 family protein [Haliscomenobacter hydrossis]|uniref:Dehydrogenase n=1 Tax=Haliscomenobacter hydrossis (strain ATCC 27775 / DSM 1100 / LMG 10767 / O) TaxID=760192 RepID=F4KRE4_HALH1|nr:nuclear transport factor 2 family protein [Haliscomenobacter hydrossis]AEE47934.1 putative dehydrogenase [Haliscomenobacter hydrossis DSM 1100]
MKTRLLFFILLLCASVLQLHAQTENPEMKAVEKTLRAYMEGDSLQFASAFHPEGQMMYIKDEKLTVVPLSEFRTRGKNGKKPERKTRILGIQIYGNAAQAQLELETSELIFHDYMSLLKTPEGWKIVSKIFYREDKKKGGS